MTWTYNTSLATSRDKVRFYLGDTDTNAQLLSDEEIDAVLTIDANVLEAAAKCADALAARYGRRTQLSIDGFSIGADKAQAFRTLAASLRSSAGQNAPGALGIPVVAGISRGTMTGVDADTDRVPSRVRTGMHDDPPGSSNDTCC